MRPFEQCPMCVQKIKIPRKNIDDDDGMILNDRRDHLGGGKASSFGGNQVVLFPTSHEQINLSSTRYPESKMFLSVMR